MNTTQVGILSGVAGFALGGATVWFAVARPRIQKVRDELSDKVFSEVERIREGYKEKEREAQLVIDSLKTDDDEPRKVPAKVETIIKEKRTKGADQLGQIISELGYAGAKFTEEDYLLANELHLDDDISYPSEDEGDGEDEGLITEDDVDAHFRENEEVLSGIHIVTEAEFSDNYYDYEFSYINYFPEDDIFCDSQDIALENVAMVVGPAAEVIKHNDMVHIFNHNLQLRIEITKMTTSYKEHIYGRRNEDDPRYQLDPKDD